MVNLATKQTNLTPRQTALLYSAFSSPLTVHTIPEIFKEVSFYERPTMEKHCCCKRISRRECEMMVWEMLKVGRVLSRHFSDIKAIWLAFDSLNISRLWFKKVLNLMGFEGWLHKGNVLAPFMFVVLYENLSTLFYFCAINYLLLKMEWMVNKEKKKKPSYLHFFLFRRTGSFAYVPVRDQNLVVRGRNFRLIGFVFISFWKGFKRKSQVAK